MAKFTPYTKEAEVDALRPEVESLMKKLDALNVPYVLCIQSACDEEGNTIIHKSANGGTKDIWTDRQMSTLLACTAFRELCESPMAAMLIRDANKILSGMQEEVSPT